jgi:Trypsin-like peptidase domain/MAP3K TRAFs-binding domain
VSWDDLPRVENALSDALNTFDWERVEELCRGLIGRLHTEPEPFPADRARSMLQKLRRKRQFQLMALVAEALLESGLQSSRIGIQYAHALIERGYLTPAELVLRSASSAAAPGSFEESEILGLLGRIGKQRYVAARNPGDPRYRAQLAAAVHEYLRGYQANPTTNCWHGINAVALIARAHRDSVTLDNLPDAGEVARRVLDTLALSRKATAQTPPWELAAVLEAEIALGDHRSAEATALEYAGDADADAFEYASTLRQLTEVWDLNDRTPPGATILPILRAALLRREGGRIQLTAAGAHADLRDVAHLEKNFGRERFRPLGWYQAGLERCHAIARIETKTGSGLGTGWLVAASVLFPSRPVEEVLLITNAHIISPTRFPGALFPQQARVNFSMSGTVCDVVEVVWTSPPSEFDTTIACLQNAPKVATLPVSQVQLGMPAPGEREPRLYIIGHPGGRDLEFSLQDNAMLECNERVVRYRTPTEGGSSGSPVFDEENWEVVALHHGGKAKMARLDGKEGTYEANEGIAIRAIQQALAGHLPDRA